MNAALPVTGLSPERIAELRREADEIAGPFIDPRLFREVERVVYGVPDDWREAVLGRQVRGLRDTSWPELILLLRAAQADAAHLAAREKAAREAHEASMRARREQEAAEYRARVAALSGAHRVAADRPIKGWAPLYHVPWSQVHPGSGGGQQGNVHLHAPGAVTLTAHTARRRTSVERGRGEALCGKDRNQQGKRHGGAGWYTRPPGEHDAIFRRCSRCEGMAERYGVAWPLADEESA